MDDNKIKKLVFIIVATVVSLISAIVGVVFGVDTDLVKDAVNIDIGICNEI